MLNLFGPQLLEVIDFDNSENLIFIDDHMCLDESVDFDIRFVNHLKKLMDADNNIHKKIIVEYANSHDFLDYADRFLSVPAQTISSCSEVNFFVPDTAWTEKTSAFNFSINKLRVNRKLLLHWLNEFNLKTKTYTFVHNECFCGVEPKYYLDNKTMKYNISAIQNKDWKNGQIYEQYLRRNVYEPSYISLITEPAWTNKSTFTSEKTIFAFEAGTIPLWVGGYGHADYFRSVGFDVFDDVIDHSYQHLSDPQQRIQFAIQNNIKLLTDINFLKKYFNSNIRKFEKNRQLVRSHAIFQKTKHTLYTKYAHWSEEEHKEIISLITYYQNSSNYLQANLS